MKKATIAGCIGFFILPAMITGWSGIGYGEREGLSGLEQIRSPLGWAINVVGFVYTWLVVVFIHVYEHVQDVEPKK